MSKFSVSQKINKTRLIADAILSNPATFVNPNPTMSTLQSACDDLELAWNEAADGGKTKTAVMHDKETALMKLLFLLAAYVSNLANGSLEIIHLAGMEAKNSPVFHNPDFEVVQALDRGAVRLRVKPHTKVAYRWEYCKDPMDANKWTVAKTTTQSTTNFGDLDEGVRYWFRVVYVGGTGETIPYNPISIIVL